MLIAKDVDQISIMKKIGFSIEAIRKQYIIKILLVLGMAIVLGTIVSNTLGQSFISSLLAIIGAAKISFVIDPVKAYMSYPLIFIIVVAATTITITSSIKKVRVEKIN